MLTDKAIRTAKPKAIHYWISDSLQARGDGTLKVRITPNNKKVFEYHYRVNRKRKSISIGSYPSMMLVDARTKASELIDIYATGKDPRVVKEAEKRKQERVEVRATEVGDTMLDLIREHLVDVESRGLKTKKRIQQCFEEWVLPNIKVTMKARDFTDDDFGDLQILLHSKGYSETSLDRLRHNMSAAFKFVLRNEKNPLKRSLKKFRIARNPILDIPLHIPVSNGRDRFLSKPELQKFWNEALAKPSGNWLSDRVRMALMLMMLTGGQRTSEVASMRWADIDLVDRVWSKKGENTKNGLDHIVPLPEMAVQILTNLKKANFNNSPWVFPSRKASNTEVEHMSYNTIGKAIKRFCFQSWDDSEITKKRKTESWYFTPFQARDVRRTCVSLMSECGISKEMRNRIHNHNIMQTVDEKHYNKHDYLDEKRQCMNDWQEWLLSVVGDSEIVYFT